MVGKEQIDDSPGLRAFLGLFFGGAAGLALGVAMGALGSRMELWVAVAPPIGAVLGLAIGAASSRKA